MLARLDGVIQRGDEYRAYSPFQQRRRNRTLAITERADGVVLLHDFGGAETIDVLAAIGLEKSDLFPPRPSSNTPHRHGKPWRPKISPREAVDLMSTECWVVLMFGRRVIDGHEVSIEDYDRARDAVARLERLRAEVGK